MKINRNSWHARFVRWSAGRKPPEDVVMADNLCEYCSDFFMSLMLAVAIIVFFLIIAAAILLSIVIFAILIFTFPNFAIPILIAVALIAFFTVRSRKNSPHGESFSIVREYIKAKKERYCPRIEWVE